MKTAYRFETPLGDLYMAERDGCVITNVSFAALPNDAIKIEKTPFLEAAFAEVLEFLQGKRKIFDFPFEMKGTPFQLSVWRQLEKIPYGETRSYAQIAKSIGNEKAVRAVGNANGKNPLALVLPCHRVIGTDGALHGFAGGVHIKRKLLEIEKAYAVL